MPVYNARNWAARGGWPGPRLYRLDWLDSFLREPHLKSLLGCFEAHASARALEQEYSSLTGEQIEARKIAEKARNMESDAVFVFKKVATYLGRGIAILNNCFNPELVILSGGLANAYDLLKEDLIEEFNL